MSSSVRMNLTTESLARQPIGKLIVKFALPSIVAMMVMSLYNIVDQLFIGRGVGFLGNAATNIVFPIVVLTIAFAMLFGDGSGALYSIRLGEGDRELARRTAGNGIIMLGLVGILFALACILFLQPLLGFFGATATIMPYAVDYAGWIVFGVPFLLMGAGMNALIRADGSPAYAMKAMMLGAILNTILDPIFIFSFEMGVKGAAIATAISQLASFMVSGWYLLKPGGMGLSRRHFEPSRAIILRVMACGSALSVSQVAIMVVIVLLNKSLAFYGARSIYGAEIPLAAQGITMKVNQIVFAVLAGMSQGVQPIIGYNFGAGNYRRVIRTYFMAVGIAFGFGLCAFIMFFFFPQVIINLFGREEALYNEFARKCFRIFLFLTALNGFTILTGALFQSMAKVRPALAIQLSRQILLMVPAVLILPRFWGIEGVLLCGPITDSLSFLLAAVLSFREVVALSKVN